MANIMFIKMHSTWLVAFALLIVAGGAGCQVSSHKQRFDPNKLYPDSWAWAAEAWTGDDVPYRASRTAIDQASGAPGRLADLLAQYKAKAEADVSDPLAVYRWAYTAYAMTLGQSSEVTHQALDGPQVAFQEAPSPHTYDYDRIRFLIGESYTDRGEAVPLGQRLLAVDKNDYAVSYRLASIFLNVCYLARIDEATALCRRMRRLRPLSPFTYSMIGFLHVIKWDTYHNPADASAVVENYQIYLKLAPPDDSFRRRAQQIINQFQARL